MFRNQIVTGTCDGTGAAINVCLGFIPSYVKVWNTDDAHTKLPVVEWLRGFKAVSALDEGIKETGLDDTDFDRTVLSANGISEYAGGDTIIYDGVTHNRWENSAGSNVEEVYVDGHYQRASGSATAYQCIGDSLAGTTTPRDGTKFETPKGFTIGTDADLNVDGEQLLWLAIR